jgi:hypothetical protein
MDSAASRAIHRGSRRRARSRPPSLTGSLTAVKSEFTMAAPAQGRVVGGLPEAEVAGMTARGRDLARHTRRAGKSSGDQATAEAGVRGPVREEEDLGAAAQAQAAEGTGMKGQVCVVGGMQCAVACVHRVAAPCVAAADTARSIRRRYPSTQAGARGARATARQEDRHGVSGCGGVQRRAAG